MDESRQRRVKIFQLQIFQLQFLILNRRKFDLYSRYTKKMKEDSSR